MTGRLRQVKATVPQQHIRLLCDHLFDAVAKLLAKAGRATL